MEKLEETRNMRTMRDMREIKIFIIIIILNYNNQLIFISFFIEYINTFIPLDNF
jgi:hypothetical protein